jgi:hypothetical protein
MKYIIEKYPSRLYVYLVMSIAIFLTVYPVYNLIFYKILIKNLIDLLPSIIIIYTILIQITPLNNNYRNIHFIIIVLVHTTFLFVASSMSPDLNNMFLGNGSSYSSLLKVPFVSFLYINAMRLTFSFLFKKEPITIGLRYGVFKEVESIYLERVERYATNYDFIWSILNFIMSGVIYTTVA